MFFVDYSADARPRPTARDGGDAADERPHGMPRTFYFGRLISRERLGAAIRFRLLCVLTRSPAWRAVPRTFSTRTGTVHALRFMELPSRLEDPPAE
jgi:hypothetical protein